MTEPNTTVGGSTTTLTRESSTSHVSSTSTAAHRHFTHAPYATTNNIIASEEFNAAEIDCFVVRGKRRDNSNLGSPAPNLPNSPGNNFSGSTPRNVATSLPTAKKNICRHFLNGNCNRGSSCRFYHPGSIHRVITANHPRTLTQRPLTPLADLAHQEQEKQQLRNTSALSAVSPVRSPYVGPTVTPITPGASHGSLSRSGTRPVISAAAIGDVNSSNVSSGDYAVSPLCLMPAALRQHSVVTLQTNQRDGSITAATAPTLSSPSNGQLNSPANSGSAAVTRHRPLLHGLPSLQLPDSAVLELESSLDLGNSYGPADATASSAPHSPATPGSYRKSIYRQGSRPGVVTSPPARLGGVMQFAALGNISSSRPDPNESSLYSAQNASTSQPPAASSENAASSSVVLTSVVRNNPYVYAGNNSSTGGNVGAVGAQRQQR